MKTSPNGPCDPIADTDSQLLDSVSAALARNGASTRRHVASNHPSGYLTHQYQTRAIANGSGKRSVRRSPTAAKE